MKGTWKPKTKEDRAYLRGVETALQLVEPWDRYVAHDFRLSDSIRAKLNLIPNSRVRLNRERIAITVIGLEEALKNR